MRDRNIEIGDIAEIDISDVYAPPAAKLVVTESTAEILKLKKRMQHSFYAAFLASFLPSLIFQMAGGVPLLFLAVFFLVPLFWLAMLVFIFLLNKRLSSVGYALFRTAIALVPILALYVLYRTSYDANKVIRANSAT